MLRVGERGDVNGLAQRLKSNRVRSASRRWAVVYQSGGAALTPFHPIPVPTSFGTSADGYTRV